MATFVAQEEVSCSRIFSNLVDQGWNLCKAYFACLSRSCNSHFVLCRQVDVAFLRAARAGNLEKVRTFLTEEGDIHTCNAVSDDILFTLQMASKL